MATRKIATKFPDRAGAKLILDDEEYEEKWGYPDSLEIYLPESKGSLKIVSYQGMIVDLSVKQPEYFEWVTALVQQSVA